MPQDNEQTLTLPPISPVPDRFRDNPQASDEWHQLGVRLQALGHSTATEQDMIRGYLISTGVRDPSVYNDRMFRSDQDTVDQRTFDPLFRRFMQNRDADGVRPRLDPDGREPGIVLPVEGGRVSLGQPTVAHLRHRRPGAPGLG